MSVALFLSLFPLVISLGLIGYYIRASNTAQSYLVAGPIGGVFLSFALLVRFVIPTGRLQEATAGIFVAASLWFFLVQVRVLLMRQKLHRHHRAEQASDSE